MNVGLLRRVAAASILVVAGLTDLGCAREPVAPIAGATIRTAWGEPDLMGVWLGQKLGATPGNDSLNLTRLEGLYRPEARARLASMAPAEDPALHCVPLGFPRSAALGWPIQIVQRPGMVLVLTEAFSSFRHIPTDGRGHLSEDLLIPFFGGDSAGKWEGETLVVDVISFRDPWLAGAFDRPLATSTGVWPASEELHVVERWGRRDADTLEYQARIEDGAMLTAPWDTPKIILKRQPAAKIQETKCLVDDPLVPPTAYLAQFGR